MAQLENIEAIEKRLWSVADLLRTGSNYASNEYFMPVMGLVFLRDQCEKELDAKSSNLWKGAEINGSRRGGNLRKEAEEARKDAVDQLKRVRYFYKQAHWLLSRFPEGELRDVEGLAKLVNHEELASNDWSLTPGRYVGVAPEEVDEDFNFEEALRDIHVELSGLNSEAVDLAAQIARNFEELGI